MHETEVAAQILRSDFPNLHIRTIRQIGSGWNNIAYLVNDSLLFRLPTARDMQNPNRTKKVECEIALLDLLHGKLDVLTPKPVHIASDHSYFGYHYLHGETLDKHPEAFNATPAKRRRFSRFLAHTSKQVASMVPVEEGQAIGLRPFGYIPTQLKYIESVLLQKTLALPAVVVKLAKHCLRDYDRFFHKALPRAVVMNGDFGPSNMLVDKKGRITAVIDWTDSCIAPVEREIASYIMWERHATWPDETAVAYEKEFGYQPDMELVYLTFFANALSDIGELLSEGAAANHPEIEMRLTQLLFWESQTPRRKHEGYRANAI